MTTWPQLAAWVHLNATASDPADPRTSGNWTDIGAYVQACTTMRGMSRFDGPVIRYEAATNMLQLKNDDARFDPLNLSGPYVSGGVTQVQPGRAYAIQAQWAGVWYYLFRGLINSWTPTYPLDGNQGVTTIDGADAFAAASRIDLGLSTDTAFYTTSPHSMAVLNDWVAYWPAIATHLPAGFNPADGVLCQDMPALLTGNALAGAQLAADTELGELYMNANAEIIMRLRNAILTDARSDTSQATFQPNTSLPFDAVTVSYDVQPVKNDVRIANVGGVTQRVQDATSYQKYGRRTYSRTDLLHTTDRESLDVAGFLLSLLKDPELRIESLTIKPQAAASGLFPQVLGRELGDRITVAFTPPGGSAISRDAIIRGIQHQITANDWTTRWTLQDATRLDSFLIFDDANRGKLDTGRMAP